MAQHQEENKWAITLLESITDGLVHIDSQWRITYVNAWIETALGKPRAAILGRRLWEAAPELLGTPFEHGYRTALRTQQLVTFEAFHPLLHKWVEVRVYPSREGIAIYIHDITERKQAETALYKSHEALRIITETIPHLVWTARPDGWLDYFNQRCFTYLQASYDQLKGDGWLQLVHPDDQVRALATWHAAIQAGQAYEIEYRVREGKTGLYHWFLVRALPLTDAQGHIIKWFGTATDIDENKRIQQALQESEARLRGLVDSNILGILVIDARGRIYEANDAFLSLVGYSRADLEAGSLQWTELIPSYNQDRVMQLREELARTDRFPPYEIELVSKEGRRVPVLMGGTTFRREGPVPLALLFVLDMTAHKAMERQKDLLLGITGHELKTPLTVLRTILQLLQRRLKRLSSTVDNLPQEWQTFVTELPKLLDDALRQIDGQTRLINDLRDVSRITSHTLSLSLQPCDIVALLRQCIADLCVLVPERTLQLTLPEQENITVQADPDRIRQVITNYVNNALRYSPPEKPVHIGLTLQNEMVRIWVRDQGPGLSLEAQKALWRPFSQGEKGSSSQRGSSKGLGLGLFICQAIITEHRGEVGVESTPGEGSTFWFTLPITS
ncbi:PAS domain S-box-containing protein [Thermosporothrix hazakensis]|uniref:histidine kinase n=1 Tax=Thermosporothrix hazakensis TaxID=644383 RepID=A0A326UJA4_THEHA|nr:PAS domain-containing sensor histidine kinase [Thermosporothrix hazakensis]PZW28509.1 PAS domain S-box-containing protein [Thermosporothrix hazakensis]GCE45283.1 hypothetical protein KTH_01520 [Thermosporothrix hazakensis]